MLTPNEIQWIGNKFDKLDRRLEEIDNRLKHIAEKAQRIVEIDKNLTGGWINRLLFQLELQHIVEELKPLVE